VTCESSVPVGPKLLLVGFDVLHGTHVPDVCPIPQHIVTPTAIGHPPMISEDDFRRVEECAAGLGMM